MTVTVKLDAPLEEQLRRRAAGTGRSTSEVIRAALVAYLEHGESSASARPPSPYELGSNLFGRHEGEAALAQDRKKLLEQAWAARHSARAT